MFPASYYEIEEFGSFIGYFGMALVIVTVILLTVAFKIKGVKKNG
jgi:hypothetical protein